MTEKPIKQLYPTNDWIFKRIYGRKGSEEITKHFIKAFLDLDIEIKDLNEQKNLETDIIDEKAGILDILVEAKDGTQIDLEMQVGNYKTIGVRLAKYASKIFSSSMKAGEDYLVAHKTIVVMFAKNELDMFKEIEKYKLNWLFRESTYHDLILTDRLEIVIISLEKIKKLIELGKIDSKSKIALWTKFLLNPRDLEEKDMKDNKEIKQAVDIYDDVTTDIGEINAAIRREMYICDVKTQIAEGRLEGLEEGIEKGKQEEKIKIAKKMLKEKIDINTISKITGLSKEEIEKLNK